MPLAAKPVTADARIIHGITMACVSIGLNALIPCTLFDPQASSLSFFLCLEANRKIVEHARSNHAVNCPSSGTVIRKKTPAIGGIFALLVNTFVDLGLS